MTRQADRLAVLERRDRALTEQVLAQRNQVAAIQGALLTRKISQERARSGDASKLADLNDHLHKLEARAAAQARRRGRGRRQRQRRRDRGQHRRDGAAARRRSGGGVRR